MTIAKRLRNKNEIILEGSPGRGRTVAAENLTMTLVFSGSEQVGVGRKNLHLYPGNFLILPKGARYSRRAQSDERVTAMSLGFSADFIREFCHKLDANADDIAAVFENSDVDQMPVAMYPFRNDLRYTVFHLKRNLEEGLLDDPLLNEYLFHCLLNYYRTFRKEVLEKTRNLSSSNPVTRSEIMKKLVVAKDYIQSNYDKKIGLKDVAREACLSVNHLLRTFQQAYQRSPHQYLQQVRLERARYLLSNTDVPVLEIAGMIGFDCPSSFIRHFKSTFSDTPGQYRNKQKGEDAHDRLRQPFNLISAGSLAELDH